MLSVSLAASELGELGTLSELSPEPALQGAVSFLARLLRDRTFRRARARSLGPSSCPYSPKLVEGRFCEVLLETVFWMFGLIIWTHLLWRSCND